MFKKDLIDLILAGKKTMTSRDKKLCDVGEITNLMANKDYSKIAGKYIKITKVYQKALGTFTDIEAQKEGFKNLADFIAYWKKNIGVWNSNKVIWIPYSTRPLEEQRYQRHG
jgi:hypothetical protein